MMTSRRVKQAFVTLAVGAFAVAATPRIASADPVTFTVNEGTVPQGLVNSFQANKITGNYVEYLFLTPTGGGNFNFTTIAVATWGDYACVGCAIPNPINQVGGLGANEYGMYAYFTAQGTFNGTTFSPSSADFNLYIDPLQNSTRTFNDTLGTIAIDTTSNDDYKILQSTTLFGGDGHITGPGTSGPRGEFDLMFSNLNFTNTTTCPAGNNPFNTNLCGGAYYFTFPAGLTLISDVNGDFDGNFNPAGGLQTARITGDLSAVFFNNAVPEPATLTLLGMGLAGIGAARKRKKAAK